MKPAPEFDAGNGSAAPAISIVIPGLDEAESLTELAERVAQALDGRHDYEIIFVDDGSTDRTWEVIGELRARFARVRGVRLRANFGKAAALSAGFSRARGKFVITLDADLQDDPSEIPKFLQAIEGGLDVVVGWKVKRHDPFDRLVLTRIFNGAVRLVTGVGLHDMNCGFKAYRREVIRTIPLYGDLFRYVPALAAWQGFRVGEVPITHHPRRHGRSRYGIERILRGFFDLLSTLFLIRYSQRPMHLFGMFGLVLGTGGAGVLGYLTTLWFEGHKIGDRPLLLLGILMVVVGVQFVSIGFIGELLAYQSHRRALDPAEPVREETE